MEMPPQDYDVVRLAGVVAIFPPRTVVAQSAEELLAALGKRRGREAE
jgi:methylmalonyl-CoA mutase cobalamin-binding subunit